MSFRSVFIAISVSFALILSAFLVQRARPRIEVDQPTAAFVKATGKCAECHANQQYSVVHEYELSKHAAKGVSCLDCHQPQQGQQKKEHNGFVIAAAITPGNCRACHEQIYQEFLRSRHAAPSWAAVFGEKGLTPEQADFAEKYHPGYVKRPANALAQLEGPSAISGGCGQCHSVGKPQDDGTVGNCTACHARHTSSVAVARLPRTCGQCHMGPDHSQIEIYEESRHGILFAAQQKNLNLTADPRSLTTRDMFVPTCATCHMSGINGQRVTHNPGERLSYFLADAISKHRPNYEQAKLNMEQICNQCHTRSLIERVYSQAEQVVASTNEKVQKAQDLVAGLRKDGSIGTQPYQQPIDFVLFDLWHYDGRTSKHGAFMGGADFVQWHGNYELLKKQVELNAMAEELSARHRRGK
ncbi:MAG TPA: ammonia-forming cytochrome c nitrite reductase subunit c552 [Candidatus Acidoferrum sp.]|nr:ammonia-forming cytochrome c nitrite reductase subunit c552 [Candidatus Acidoferrum sp.]